MSDEQPPKPRNAAPLGREDRLKSALKANLSRRKRQARARDAEAAPAEPDNAAPADPDNKD